MNVGELAILTFAVAILLLGGLQMFLTYTSLGCQIRATAEDPDTVELVGVNSRFVNAVAASIALVTVALAGLFLGLRATFDPYSGSLQLIFAFEAAVIGGTGSLWGTLRGGIVLGRCPNFWRASSSTRFLAGWARGVPSGSCRTPLRPRTVFSRFPQIKIIREIFMSAYSNISIQRWTNLSIGVAIIVGLALALLLAGPAFMPDTMLDKLTVLFIYVLLAAMWNALAGYGGMISAGQQAFFGIGGYLAIRLSEWGVEPYLALILAALLAGLSALPISAIVLRLRAGEFAIGMWVIAEVARLLVNLDPMIQGDTGRSLIAFEL